MIKRNKYLFVIIIAVILAGIFLSYQFYFKNSYEKWLCESKEGIWGYTGKVKEKSCNEKAEDVGKICKDNNECQGLCLAELSPEQFETYKKNKEVKATGKCSEYKQNGGCFKVIEDGYFRGDICID